MPKSEIEEFAKILVRDVRDAAIQSGNRRLRPDAIHVIAKRWREAARAGQLEPIAKTLIPDTVDNTIYYLLRAIDEGLLKISFTDSNGRTVNLTEEGLGELAGWYVGGIDGWREKYSTERVPDDFTDLK